MRVSDLDVALSRSDSATEVLERFFAMPILVRRLPELALDAAPEQLTYGVAETLRHRRVELMAGETAVSRAELWYVPERLPAELVKMLDTTSNRSDA